MARPSRRLSITRDAVEIVLRRLSSMATSPEVEDLRARAQECLQKVEGWKVAAPTAEERDRLMKRILNLHVEVASMERQAGK
jgi:vacuolar-type H+-ATPase subunit E/Vma4